MKFNISEFVKSAYNQSHWVEGNLPEISFLGRSNVGKSSLLNALLDTKKLARTSNTPGRTQCINFFLVNEKFYFVDLPGYGYAKVSKVMRKDWGKMAEEYLAKREQLVLSIQLVDSRHEPTVLDKQLHEWLTYYRKPNIVIATKSDKLSTAKLKKSIELIEKTLPDSKILPFSALKNTGREDIWREIVEKLNQK